MLEVIGDVLKCADDVEAVGPVAFEKQNIFNVLLGNPVLTLEVVVHDVADVLCQPQLARSSVVIPFVLGGYSLSASPRL